MGRRKVWLVVPAGLALTLAGAIDGAPRQPETADPIMIQPPLRSGELSVLTYNVKGLPWPLASGRPEALAHIGERLARMRREGRQPHVVVLQEAFTSDAKQIGRIAGYPYVIEGPYVRGAPGAEASPAREWRLGETRAAAVDSGLVLLSDLPVRDVQRVAFAPEDCAGYDCLAAKGVLMVELDTGDRGPVVVATTHLNCQGASGAPKARTTAAFGRQIAFVAGLLAKVHARGVPVIVAGDFNQGRRPQRVALLQAALHGVAGTPVRDALDLDLDADPRDGQQIDAIRRHARDLQFAFDGRDVQLAPEAVSIPFGREADGSMLSDHMGYTVRYRLAPGAGTS